MYAIVFIAGSRIFCDRKKIVYRIKYNTFLQKLQFSLTKNFYFYFFLRRYIKERMEEKLQKGPKFISKDI